MLSQLALSIDKGYRLPEPVEMNVYKMTPEELKENGIESLPESIGEAIAETERSTIVRQSSEVDVFDHLIELKKKEWDYYRTHLSQYDIDRSSDSVIYPLDGKQPLRSVSSFFYALCSISCEVEDYLFVEFASVDGGTKDLQSIRTARP